MDDNFCSIAIYLYGDSISLNDASLLLGLTPTRSHNRGDTKLTSSGSEVIQKTGFWEYRLRVNVNQISSSLTDVISRIKCDRVVGVAGIDKAELDIFVPLDVESDQAGLSMELSSLFLKNLSALGLDLVVTSR